MNKFIEELKRRNVIKASLAYLVVAWVLLQVVSTLLEIVDAPEWAIQAFTIILIVGLPIWIIISWIYEITPEGIEKTAKDSGSELVTQATNKRLNVFIIVSLSIAVVVMGLKLSNFFASDSDIQYAIAILPFDNIKVDKDNEWLGESFALDVNTYLSNLNKLQVIDFHSSRIYKDSDKTNMVIGNELGVSFILRGTLRQIKNKVIITVRLYDVISNEAVWSINYEENIEGNILSIQQRVSQKIVDELEIRLTPEEEKSLERYSTENPEAYGFYAQANIIANKRTEANKEKSLETSVELYKKAIELDPDFAEAYAEMAFILRLLPAENKVFENENKIEKIKYLIDKSLEINTNTARAYTTLGAIEGFKNEDWEKAKEFFEKALEIKPNDATNHHYYAFYFSNRANPEYKRALEETIIAQKFNPLSIPINANIIGYLLNNEKIIEAKEFYKNNSQLFPYDEKLKLKKSILSANVKKESLEKKDWTEAINLYHREIEIDTNSSYLYRKMGEAYNEILNDDDNYVKYTKKAYELGMLNFENATTSFYSENGESYYFSLLKSENFNEANNLLKDIYFESLFSNPYKIYFLFYYYYHQENYMKAQKKIDSSQYKLNFEESINYAKQNEVSKVNSILNKDVLKDYEKAIVFAILKERDSMYYYINKEKDIDNILKINGFIEIDPYRKEERYKAFLRKNYLPITHWNK
jgi:TolB-like protein/Tfp pilus assembly protein PilF